MSARDEAIEAGSWAETLEVGRVGGVVARAVLNAAHASGAIVYADELEQVGWLPMDEIRPQHSEVTTWTPVYSRAMGEGWVSVYRKRPQEPNE